MLKALGEIKPMTYCGRLGSVRRERAAGIDEGCCLAEQSEKTRRRLLFAAEFYTLSIFAPDLRKPLASGGKACCRSGACPCPEWVEPRTQFEFAWRGD